ncbi:MAG: hypothetical protein ACD_3C00109G0010 [uncultured bacterium (gcode 4)]|uniref:Uncharacterized protein n=1 Tax=uncultured bacterium (gcode 4) TaxID=1234023 RepID=K2FA67_9BACT|nr:MAG: hypothetical protein ACD_3C00109G0010 [uncultured bacterium (gcode 4)]
MINQNLDDILWLLGKGFDTIAEELWHSPEEAREVVQAVLDNKDKTASILEDKDLWTIDTDVSDLDWEELKILIEKKYSVQIIDDALNAHEIFGIFWTVKLDNLKLVPLVWDALFMMLWMDEIVSIIELKLSDDKFIWKAKVKWNPLTIDFSISKINWIWEMHKEEFDSQSTTQSYKDWGDLKIQLQDKYKIVINLGDATIVTNNNWVLYGILDNFWNPWLKVPFVWTKILSSFAWNPVKDTRSLAFWQYWAYLKWEVQLSDWDWYRFEWENLIWKEDIAWVQIYSDWSILEHIIQNKYKINILDKKYELTNWHNGNFYWSVTTDEWYKIPFFWDHLYDRFWLKKVTDSKNISFSSISWDLYCNIRLDDWVWYEYNWWPTLWDRLKIYNDWNDISSTIEKSHNLSIDCCVENYIQADWSMAWKLKLTTGVILPFQWIRLFTNIWWREIKDCSGIHTVSSWFLAWDVQLEDNLWHDFEGDTIKWYSPLHRN